MQQLKNLQGLRFPDEYVVRMFFKERLHEQPGRVLELGCGSGNNLILFQEYEWEVIGIDISRESLSNASHNLNCESKSANLITMDLSKEIPVFEKQFDAIILPSFNYYIPRAQFQNILNFCSAYLCEGGIFFLRSRTCQDWRYGRGRKVENNGFILDCKETGEDGCLNVFYEKNELTNMIENSFEKLNHINVLSTKYENIQNGVVIANDDVVIWGRN